MAVSMFILAPTAEESMPRPGPTPPRRGARPPQTGRRINLGRFITFSSLIVPTKQRRGAESHMSESESIDTVNQPLARATLDAIRARWQRDEADLDSKTEHLLNAAEDLTCDKDDYCILPKGHEGPCVIAGVDIPQEATSEEAVAAAIAQLNEAFRDAVAAAYDAEHAPSQDLADIDDAPAMPTHGPNQAPAPADGAIFRKIIAQRFDEYGWKVRPAGAARRAC